MELNYNPCMSISTISKIKAQLPTSNKCPAHRYHPFCVHGHYTPPVRTTKAHTHTSLSISPYSPLVLYGLQICLCVYLGGKGGRNGGSVIEWTHWLKKIYAQCTYPHHMPTCTQMTFIHLSRLPRLDPAPNHQGSLPARTNSKACMHMLHHCKYSFQYWLHTMLISTYSVSITHH